MRRASPTIAGALTSSPSYRGSSIAWGRRVPAASPRLPAVTASASPVDHAVRRTSRKTSPASSSVASTADPAVRSPSRITPSRTSSTADRLARLMLAGSSISASVLRWSSAPSRTVRWVGPSWLSSWSAPSGGTSTVVLPLTAGARVRLARNGPMSVFTRPPASTPITAPASATVRTASTTPTRRTTPTGPPGRPGPAGAASVAHAGPGECPRPRARAARSPHRPC